MCLDIDMTITGEVQLPLEIEKTFAWFTRPGAVRRLLPPWLPLHVRSEASSLRNGTAVLDLPGAVQWIAQHQPDEYQPEGKFVDELVSGGIRTLPTRVLSWRHEHEFEPVSAEVTRVIDRVKTSLPGSSVRRMLDYRYRQLSGDFAAHHDGAQVGMQSLTVAVTGSSGMVGRALCAFLSTGGHRVIRLVRTAGQNENERRWDPQNPDQQLLSGVDAVIHLAGASIFGRFGHEHRMAVVASRIEPTRRLAQLAAASGVKTFVSASAVGIYGSQAGETPLDENAMAGYGGEDFLVDVVRRWESAARSAHTDQMRTVQVRTGVVLDSSGGMLSVLRPLYAAGLGGRLGSGKQWLSWIGLDDLLDIYHRALWDQSLHGPVNAVSPNPVRNAEFSQRFGAVLKRPAIIPVPALGPKLVLGNHGAHLLALADQRVIPRVLLENNHRFRTERIEQVLAHTLGRVS